MLYRNICECCGGNVEKFGDKYICEYCENTYSVEKFENYAEKISQLFDEFKLEMIANARKNLYKAITAPYISSEEVYSCCVEIKKYLPDDFQANFYEAAVNSAPARVAKLIYEIDVQEHYENLDLILNFLIASLRIEWVTALAMLIERAYKAVDLRKYGKYASMLEEETEKLDNCVYLTSYPRDVFVAYSSKDIDKAIELVEVLEEQGLSCFISIRNLRHGAGSRENYEKALQEAMDNCGSFVFVSSMNSRNQACDALKVEIPYIKRKDVENAKGYAQASYANIPHELKKSRVEYRLEESNRLFAADRIVDEFFAGYERVYSPIDVAERVMRQATEAVVVQKSLNNVIEKATTLNVANVDNYDASYSNSSEGLEFYLNPDKKSYKLVGIGTCTNKYITVDTYNGLPVTAIDDNVFSNCENLINITLGDSIARIGNNIFEGCTNLTSAILGNGITTINTKTFNKCGKLKNVTLGEKLLNINENAFESCESLVSITLPNSLTTIGAGAFARCKSLASIIIPDRVTSIDDGAFAYCESLASIIIPDGLRRIGENAFGACESLSDITIPNSVTCIEDWTFWGCSKLKTITIPKTVTSIDSAYRIFEECKSLINITVDELNPEYKSIEGNLYTKDGKKLLYYALGKKDTAFVIPNSVTSIDDCAFYGSLNLTSITIPDSVTQIGYGTFWGCNNLINIIIPNSVTSIGEATFFYCRSLENVTIPNSVKSVEGEFHKGTLFEDCNNLKSLAIPFLGARDPENEKNKLKSFFNSGRIPSTLKTLIITSEKNINEGAFEDCDNLESITIPFGCVSNNGNKNVKFSQFFGRNGVPSTLKSVLVLGGNEISADAFSGCKNITSITIPESVKRIECNAFRVCSSIKSIIIPNSVTYIGKNAFTGCDELVDIIIPKSVTEIDVTAFDYCDKLCHIYCFNDYNQKNNKICYYSEKKPFLKFGKRYWRYVNGVPTEW